MNRKRFNACLASLRGERNRGFVLSPIQEPVYLAACPASLADIAVVLLDTGLRVGEALRLPDSQLDQQHSRVRKLLKLPADFVLHSLRHTFGTRLGEAGADAFTIMKLMGHSTVTASQRYVHPSPEAVELAFERLTALNLRRVPTNLPTVEQRSEDMVQ